ncbi:YcnI family protein [Plantibacter sp. Mn2098]|uniref:YcnI family copper-binding membrane protein n=1 Tax=Plantibacter sp. Mn2098 TaxID=3395266 RepID=UPI003BE0B11A
MNTNTSNNAVPASAAPAASGRSARAGKIRNGAIAFAALGGGALLAVGAPLAASAHVSVDPSSGAAGSYAVLTFAVGHGCEGSPTTSLTFQIPEEINAVTPTVDANWDIAKNLVPLAKPVTDAHGNQLAERVGTVVYTAKTPLADGYRDTVSFQVQLPADAANTSLVFPVTQTCEVGQTVWDQVAKKGQDPESLESPAPTVAVGPAAAASGHGHGDDDGDGDGDSATPAAHDDAATSTGASVDVLGRVLGIAGLALGAVGIVVAVSARRGRGAAAGAGAGASGGTSGTSTTSGTTDSDNTNKGGE